MNKYKEDLKFLSSHYKIVELQSGNARVAVCPDLQGRVFTSAHDGEQGSSFGWINYDLIASGKLLEHCNNFGGEDRFWIGPEGGQYSVFFQPGTAFDLDHWQTPAVIDSEAWNLDAFDKQSAHFSKQMTLKNYAGHQLQIQANREVVIFDDQRISGELGAEVPEGVQCVGYQSNNVLTNQGDFVWDKNTGMPSIWILGQMISGDRNTIMIPVKTAGTGPLMNDAYFGRIDEDRLKVEDGTIFYKGDGKQRGKIGIGPERVIPIMGSYNADSGVLTIVKFSFDKENSTYVNAMWEHQENPFVGDVANSYNDGPLPDGSQMGPFYELESSSPAAALAPGEHLVHAHTTFHLQGDQSQLEKISRALLGVGLEARFK